ncbi:MAG: hypothetical protein ACT4NT_07455 [Nitrososphaerota archaeon]
MKEDILAVIEQKALEEKSEPTMALLHLPREVREMLLCHFFTAEKTSKQYSRLFSEYDDLMKFERKMRIDNVNIHEYLEKVAFWLWEFEEPYIYDKKTKTEFYRDAFYHALNLDEPMKLLQIEYMEEAVEGIRRFSSFDIDREEYPIYYVTLNRVRILKTDSEETTNKCFEGLTERIRKLEEMISHSSFAMSTEVFARLKWYDRILKSNFEVIKRGEPIIGSCKGCIQYFTGNEKAKFEKYIEKFEGVKDSVL